MANFSIKVDLSSVVGQARGIIDESIFPRLNQAVSAVAQQAMIDWKEAVGRAKLWTGEKVPYGESITWKMTGAFSAEVWSDYKYAKEIDEGRPARDLKKMLDTSHKTRIAKDGKRYLIIPFRHQAPGSDAIGQSMPADVYELARNLSPSRVTGSKRLVVGHDIKSRKPLLITKRSYAWGGSLNFMDEKQFMAAPNALKRHQGMYRFDTSSGKAKSSTYLTFRVMKEGSPGWIVAPKPGLHLVQQVTTRLQPLAEKAFSEAVKRDLS
jgi:hypothetical protein